MNSVSSADCNLSFVITTFNKIDYLKVVVEYLLKHVNCDEEIIVVDGGSSDGTQEYLTRLFTEKKISKYISEKDNGESDGFNKGIKLSAGLIVKLITDDDIFSYSEIRRCKDYLINNPSVDFLNTNGGWINEGRTAIYGFTNIYEAFFRKVWLISGHPFAHCCLGIMFRKASLEKVGYLSTEYVRADAEYSLRMTSSDVNFVWYTGVAYVRVLNTSSNSAKYADKIKKETERLNEQYGFDIDRIYESLDLRDSLSKRVKNFLFQKLGLGKYSLEYKTSFKNFAKEPNASFADIYNSVQEWLVKINSHKKGEFLSK